MRRLLCLFWLFLPASPAAANPAALCDRAAVAAAATHGVPEQVMLAITRVETGRKQNGALQPWPWAVNLGGPGQWPETRDEAIALAQSELDGGRLNMDIGCFQLNIRWHSRGFASLEDMFDPDLNADYAAGFLADLYQSEGSWEAAVAAYHSHSPELAEAYLDRVAGVLARLDPTPDLDPPPEVRANLYPLLQPGGAPAGGSLVGSRTGLMPLIGTRS